MAFRLGQAPSRSDNYAQMIQRFRRALRSQPQPDLGVEALMVDHAKVVFWKRVPILTESS